MPRADLAEEWKKRLPGLDRLWKLTAGRPEIRIAVLDGPVDAASVARTHLAPSGVVDHATLVQSIIVGSSDDVVPGIAPGCTVLSIPIFDEPACANVQPSCSQARLAEGVRSAIAKGANVINISAAQQADLLALESELSGAVQDALDRDMLIVAAAGNQGCACDTIPASVAGVLAVGAHDDNGEPLLSSNWGPNQRAQGVVAPGRDVPGACVGGGLCRASGTSFAAATVSAVAALLMSADVEQGVIPSGRRIRRVLLESCAPPQPVEVEIAGTYLAGRLDVGRAVDHLCAIAAPRRNGVGGAGEENLSVSSIANERADQEACLSGSARTVDPAAQPPSAANTALVPAHCGCGCGGSGGKCSCSEQGMKLQLAYAIGQLGVGFPSQTRRDAIWRSINKGKDKDFEPVTKSTLLRLFRDSPYEAQSVVWTLNRDSVPIYAIVPAGAFAANTYRLLVEHCSSDIDFVSVPGIVGGSVTLDDGLTVDAIVPDQRGIEFWNMAQYKDALRAAWRRSHPEAPEERLQRELGRFLDKIAFSIRNAGRSPGERAINAAATNAFNLSSVILEAGSEGLSFRDVAVERSPFNRPGTQCYDVLLTFFDPAKRYERAPLRARFTIDVSDTVPVPVGDPVSWYEY